MFDAIVFTVAMCGYNPRCALEVDNAVRNRLDKIGDLIAECRLGIHDISRVELTGPNKLPRFNMPLELGLFLGAARYGSAIQRRKQCIVLDTDPYRFRESISDISGQDVAAHRDSPAVAISAVRGFLAVSSRADLPGGKAIAAVWHEFRHSLPELLRPLRLEPSEMTFPDLTRTLVRWLRSRAAG